MYESTVMPSSIRTPEVLGETQTLGNECNEFDPCDSLAQNQAGLAWSLTEGVWVRAT